MKSFLFLKIGEFSTVNANDPDAVLKVVIAVELELLQTTLSAQAPAVTAGLMAAVITVSDMMLQDTVGSSQTVAAQDCDSETKFVPEMVIVEPE